MDLLAFTWRYGYGIGEMLLLEEETQSGAFSLHRIRTFLSDDTLGQVDGRKCLCLYIQTDQTIHPILFPCPIDEMKDVLLIRLTGTVRMNRFLCYSEKSLYCLQ